MLRLLGLERWVMVAEGQKRGREGSGMGVCSQSYAVGVVSHDSGSLLDGKNHMLVLGFFFWSLLLCFLNAGQLRSQEA